MTRLRIATGLFFASFQVQAADGVPADPNKCVSTEVSRADSSLNVRFTNNCGKNVTAIAFTVKQSVGATGQTAVRYEGVDWVNALTPSYGAVPGTDDDILRAGASINVRTSPPLDAPDSEGSATVTAAVFEDLSSAGNREQISRFANFRQEFLKGLLERRAYLPRIARYSDAVAELRRLDIRWDEGRGWGRPWSAEASKLHPTVRDTLLQNIAQGIERNGSKDWEVLISVVMRTTDEYVAVLMRHTGIRLPQ